MGIYINNNGTIERKDGAPGPAGSIAYDNSQSGLVSNNVQNAIDEVNERVIENISDNASIELTATAAHAHAVGTSFMLIGQLVKATSAIAVGDTIALGTNVEPTSVLDLLGDVNAALNGKQDKLTNPLTKADVVNNLTSDATNVPLSAAMGKSLNTSIGNIGTTIYGHLQMTSVPSKTITKIDGITLPEGTWIVIACANSLSGNGTLLLSFENSLNPPRSRGSTGVLLTDRQSFIQLTSIYKNSESNKIDLFIYHTNSSGLTVYPVIHAIRIA